MVHDEHSNYLEMKDQDENVDQFPKSAIIKVAGKPFRCECGANVFTEYERLKYSCNGCGAHYQGETLNGEEPVETYEYKDKPFYMEPLNGVGPWELYVAHKDYTKSVIKVVSDSYVTLLILAYGYLATDDEVRGFDMHFEGRHHWNIRLLSNGKYQVHHGNVNLWDKAEVLEWLSYD